MKVLKTGRYKVEVLRWPAESDKKINEALPPGRAVPGASKTFREAKGASIQASKATLRLDGKDLQSKPVKDGDRAVGFEIELKEGKHELSPYFTVPQGELGCYYMVITALD